MWTTHERKHWMVTLFFGCTLLYAARNILPVCSTAMATELNWRRQDEGLVMGIFFWGYMLTQFIGGLLSDTFGGQLVILSTTIVWGCITATFTIIPLVSSHQDTTFYIFLLSRFMLGLFQGFFYPSLASLMANHVDTPERQFTYAFLTSGSHAGTLLCGFVGSFLTEIYSWRVPFFFIGSLAVLWSMFTIQYHLAHPTSAIYNDHISHPVLYPRFLSRSIKVTSSTPSLHSLSSKVTSSDVMEGCYNYDKLDNLKHSEDAKFGAKSSACKINYPLNWRLLLRKPAFWAMLLGNFVFNNTFYILLNWLPSYFLDNFPSAESWIFNVVPWLIVIPCSLLSGIIADRLITRGISVTFVRKLLATVALMGTSLFLLILPEVSSFPAALLCLALAIACCGFHNSGILLNPQDIAPFHGGQVFGIMSTIGTIPGFTGVYLTGYILQRFHDWASVFHVAVTGNVIGWFVFVIFGSAESIV